MFHVPIVIYLQKARSTIALSEEISSLQQGNQIPRTVIPRYNSDLILINTGPVRDVMIRFVWDEMFHVLIVSYPPNPRSTINLGEEISSLEQGNRIPSTRAYRIEIKKTRFLRAAHSNSLPAAPTVRWRPRFTFMGSDKRAGVRTLVRMWNLEGACIYRIYRRMVESRPRQKANGCFPRF